MVGFLHIRHVLIVELICFELHQRLGVFRFCFSSWVLLAVLLHRQTNAEAPFGNLRAFNVAESLRTMTGILSTPPAPQSEACYVKHHGISHLQDKKTVGGGWQK